MIPFPRRMLAAAVLGQAVGVVLLAIVVGGIGLFGLGVPSSQALVSGIVSALVA